MKEFSPTAKTEIKQSKMPFEFKWNVRKKLYSGFSLAILVLLSLAIYGVNTLVGVKNALIDVANGESDNIHTLAEQMSHDVNVKVIVILVGVLVLSLFIMVVAVLTSKHILRPVLALTEVSKKIADGDLTVELPTTEHKDEIGELTESFGIMATSFRSLTQELSTNTEHVASASEQLMASSEQAAVASEQISNTIQEVADGASTQNSEIKKSREQLEDMFNNLEQIVNASYRVGEQTEATSLETKKGREMLDKVIQQMNHIQNAVDGTAALFKGLEDRSKDIENFTGVIASIADQTNLLSLNAAIEAARAGEHGKGFAVVAQEVRKLADQSKAAADEIREVVAKIQGSIGVAVQSMHAGIKGVAAYAEVVNETGEGFDRIEDAITTANLSVADLLERAENALDSIDVVKDSITQVSELAESAEMNTQTIASATQQQLASTEEVQSASESLAHMAETLLTKVQKFKV